VRCELAQIRTAKPPETIGWDEVKFGRGRKIFRGSLAGRGSVWKTRKRSENAGAETVPDITSRRKESLIFGGGICSQRGMQEKKPKGKATFLIALPDSKVKRGCERWRVGDAFREAHYALKRQ